MRALFVLLLLTLSAVIFVTVHTPLVSDMKNSIDKYPIRVYSDYYKDTP